MLSRKDSRRLASVNTQPRYGVLVSNFNVLKKMNKVALFVKHMRLDVLWYSCIPPGQMSLLYNPLSITIVARSVF